MATKPAGYKFPKTLAKTYTTPRAVARWPRLNQPDTKFSKPGEPGDYKIEVILSADQGATLLDMVKEVQREAVKLYKSLEKKTPKLCDSLPVFPELDEEGNETGNMIFRAKVKAGGTNNDGETFTRSVPLFDAHMKPIRKANVGGGSEVRVSATLMPFHNSGIGLGVRAQLDGVQILKLVTGSGRTAEQMGFEEEEDGYVSDDYVEETPAGAAKAQAGDDKDGL